MQRRMTACVSGRVQGVGFRDIILDIADRLVLTGYVENLKDGNVKIIAEGDEKNLSQLMELINVITDPFLKIINIEISFSDPTGEWQYFSIIFGDPATETFERLGIGVRILKDHTRILNEHTGILNGHTGILNGHTGILNGHTGILNDHTRILNEHSEKLDNLTEKTDEQIKIQFNINDAVNGMNDILLKIEENGVEALEVAKTTQKDIKSVFEQELSEIKVELKEMRAALIRAHIIDL